MMGHELTRTNTKERKREILPVIIVISMMITPGKFNPFDTETHLLDFFHVKPLSKPLSYEQGLMHQLVINGTANCCSGN